MGQQFQEMLGISNQALQVAQEAGARSISLENLARGHVGGVGQPPHQPDVHGAPIDPPPRGNLFGARVVGQNPRQPLPEGENGLGGVLRTGGGSSGPKAPKPKSPEEYDPAMKRDVDTWLFQVDVYYALHSEMTDYGEDHQ